MLRARDGVGPVQALLTGYLVALEQRIRVGSAVVFGSRARGDHLSQSDIDLAVVSPDFEGLSRWDRLGLLLRDWPGSPALEPVGYTADEVLRLDHLLLVDAVSDGRILKDDGGWALAQSRLRDYLNQGILERTPGGWRVSGQLHEDQAATP